MIQSRRLSLVETWTQTLVGYFLNLGLQLIIFPFFGAVFTLSQNVGIGLIFLVSSVLRGYAIRRLFIRYHQQLVRILHK